jgi:hypothetical protein
MKKDTIFKYKLLLVLILFIFLLIFSISTFKEGATNKSSNKKNTNSRAPANSTVPAPSTAPAPTTVQSPTTVPAPTTVQAPTTVPSRVPSTSNIETSVNIRDGNYIIYSMSFNSPLSVYPNPPKCEDTKPINAPESSMHTYNVMAISNTYAVTDIWTIKTIDGETTLQQYNCNYLILESVPSNPFKFTDPNTQILKVGDTSSNIISWKIIKDPYDSTYTIVPFNNQNINLYNYSYNYNNMDYNMFINNNNNNTGKIAKFIFNKIS